MARAYMKLDPYVYDRKVLGRDHRGAPIPGWSAYPSDALVTFFGVLALAELQPERGRFRSDRLLRELLRGADGQGARYARQVPYLVERGDLVVLAGGQIYVVGWDEWQEGDLKVPARMVAVHRRRHDEEGTISAGALRMRRYRERHSDASPVTSVTASRDVTEDVTRARDVTVDTEAVTVNGDGDGDANGGRHGGGRLNGAPPRELSLDERREVATAAIGQARSIVEDPNSSEAAKRAAAHAIERGEATLAQVASQEATPAGEPPDAQLAPRPKSVSRPRRASA